LFCAFYAGMVGAGAWLFTADPRTRMAAMVTSLAAFAAGATNV
jgi:hypothetical protein